MKQPRIVASRLKAIKKVLAFVVFSFAFLPVQAKDGDQLKLEAGSAKVIWTSASAYLDLDFSEAKVEGKTWDEWLKSKGDDFVRDWPSDKNKVANYFMYRFNKKTKKKGGLRLQVTNPDDTYKLVIHPTDIDMGSIGGGVVAGAFLGAFAKKAGGAVLKDGYIDVVNQADGKVVCRLSFKDVKGDSGISVNAQLILLFEDLYDEIFGFADRFGSEQKPEIQLEAVQQADEAPAQEEAHAAAPVAATAVAATTTATTKAVAKTTAVRKKTAAKAPVRKASSSVSRGRTATAAKSSVRTSAASSSQAGNGGLTSVKLKSGATIKGTLKSFDPLTNIVLVIAGKETVIPMDKVESVEAAQGGSSASTSVVSKPTTTTRHTVATSPRRTYTQSQPQPALGNNKLVVTETEDYPEAIDVAVGNTTIPMVLVKGGRMNMGYDGDGSLRMHSEPIHEVVVTSFYISTDPVPASLALQYADAKNIDGVGSEPAEVRDYADVERIISGIDRATGLGFRLPTEAEWEFAACGDMQNSVFGITRKGKVAYEWCSDFLDDFPEQSAVLTDPTGPMTGEQHVIRSFNSDRGKFDRSNKIDEDNAYLGLVRLVIKAKDVK